MTEKTAVVKINTDGEVAVCAKGLDTSECGYVPGAKVCGKCGALAMSVKSMYAEMGTSIPKKKKKNSAAGAMALDDDMDVEIDEKASMEDEEIMEEDDDDMEDMYVQQASPMKKKKKAAAIATLEDVDDMDDMEVIDEDDEDDDEEMMDDEEVPAKMYGMGKPQKRLKMKDIHDGKMMDVDEDDEDEDEDDEMVMPRKKIRRMPMEESDEETVDMMDDESGEKSADIYKTIEQTRNNMRDIRIKSMGFKSEDFDDEAYVCAFDRKVYPGGASVCDSCPGGCVSEKGMPSLLEVEGMAEDMFRGKVLDSGYSDEADLFVVDVERKDGKPVEIFFDGSNGEVMGWHVLSNDVMEVKSALQDRALVSFGDAADIAVKSVEGDIIAVEPDVFEGFDVYAVEIEGLDGKSYDVFVSLDGEVLGYDEYTQEEASEIEAEAAEVALKRAYSDESRTSMSKTGQAMPDGSFPVKDEADLRNAIQAFGRAKNQDATKMHIMKRAVDLGLEDLVPSGWTGLEKSEKSVSIVGNSEEANFLSSLMEFQILTVDEELNKTDSE